MTADESDPETEAFYAATLRRFYKRYGVVPFSERGTVANGNGVQWSKWATLTVSLVVGIVGGAFGAGVWKESNVNEHRIIAARIAAAEAVSQSMSTDIALFRRDMMALIDGQQKIGNRQEIVLAILCGGEVTTDIRRLCRLSGYNGTTP